jgi:hypothetical protein
VAAITVAREIKAPVAVVYETIADPQRFARAISGVTKLDILFLIVVRRRYPFPNGFTPLTMHVKTASRRLLCEGESR